MKKKIQYTGKASDIYSNPRIFVTQEGYVLDERRYRILITLNSNWKDWSTRLFFIFLGSLITIFAKIIGKISNNENFNLNSWYKHWEVWFCILSFVLFLIIKLVDIFYNDERKKLIKEIKEHFEKNPPIIEVKK